MSGEFVRVCPNPENNPGCKGVMNYTTHGNKLAADRSSAVCKSCGRFGFVTSEETKVKLSDSCKGRVSPFLGRKHTDEARAKMSFVHSGMTLTEEHRKRIGAASKGHKLHTVGEFIRVCPNVDNNPNCKRILRYETQEAVDKADANGSVCMKCAQLGCLRTEESRLKMRKARTPEVIRMMNESKAKNGVFDKLSARMSGSRNPMFGKPPPIGAATCSISGWYKNVFFRSSCELRFLMTHPEIIWKTGERIGLSIEYIDRNGIPRNYFPDFYGNGIVVEVKQLGTKVDDTNSDIPYKLSAAARFCEKSGFDYVLVQISSIPKRKIFRLRKEGIIELNSIWEERYQEWRLKGEK